MPFTRTDADFWETTKVFKWLREFFSGSQAEQDRGLESLKTYVEQRQQEIFDDYQKQLAAGTLNLAPNDESQVDPREELKRAHLLMLQAQELLAIGNTKGAIAALEEANRINKKYSQR